MVHPTTLRRSATVVTAMLVVGLCGLSAASAPLAGHVSNARAQALGVALPGADVAEWVLAAAVAENDGGSRVIDLGALDPGPLDELGLALGQLSLLGDNGFLVLGAVNQYAEAAGDGFSYAAAGAVSDAGLVEIPDDATPGTSGASLTIGTDALGHGDLVELQVEAGALASTATWPAGGEPEGSWLIADLRVKVGGSLIEDAAAEIDAAIAPAAEQLTALGGLLGIDTSIENPLDDGILNVTDHHLASAAGAPTLSDLPPGTDPLQYLAEAVAAALSAAADDVVGQVEDAVADLRASPEFGAVCAPPLLPPDPLCGVLDTVAATIADALAQALEAIAETILGPLGDAVAGLLGLSVGRESVGADGSFSVTALSAAVGADGEFGRVDLATSTVGPNAPPS